MEIDDKIIELCVRGHRLKPGWDNLAYLRDCLHNDGQVQQRDALMLALHKNAGVTLSAFIGPGLAALGHPLPPTMWKPDYKPTKGAKNDP